MFSTLGNMTYACTGDLQSLFFPGQQAAEIIDCLIFAITLIASAILISQGNYLAGAPLLAITAFQSHIVLGNLALLIKRFRVQYGLLQS